jgi:hypothetical protein
MTLVYADLLSRPPVLSTKSFLDPLVFLDNPLNPSFNVWDTARRNKQGAYKTLSLLPRRTHAR